MAHIELLEEKLEAVANLPHEGPVVMLNLLRFKGEAGRASFEKYMEHARPLGEKVGVRLMYAGAGQVSVIGPEQWDLVVLAEYPNRAAFLSLVQSAEYKVIVHYRNEALEDSRLILTTALSM